MKKIVLAMAFLALGAGAALAGPNAGVTMTPQGNIQCAETNGDPCGAIALPASCDATDPNACPDLTGVEWFLAVCAGQSELAFATCIFGLGPYDPYDSYLSVYGPCFADMVTTEVPSAEWPGPNSGTAVTWAPNCLTGMLVPVYYFGFYIYAYDGTPGGPVPLGDFYPGQEASVVSCTSPPESDPIEDPDNDGFFGILGVGDDPGKRECPEPQVEEGACCNLLTGECMLMTEDECNALGADYLWDGSPSCDPNPCPPPVATKPTTWGQIKSLYR